MLAGGQGTFGALYGYFICFTYCVCEANGLYGYDAATKENDNERTGSL